MAIYSTNGVTVKFEDNSPEVLAALKRATVRGLEACGARAESYAKKELSRSKPHKRGPSRPNVITGRLRNSVAHKVENNTMYVGSNVEYAAAVELGTRKSWAYPYLKPACTEHNPEYKQILTDSLKNA